MLLEPLGLSLFSLLGLAHLINTFLDVNGRI